LPSSPIVDDFAFDEENEEEMATHGISPGEIFQVLDSPHAVKKNRGGRRASHMLIGRNHQDQCIAIPIEPTRERAVWRPVTAWHCKAAEWGWLPPKK
jgi:hypothetical protein